jgi:hypothetical protein
MTWHQWHQTALRASRTGLWSLFASEKGPAPHCCQCISAALFGRGENLKSDAREVWLIKKKIVRMAAANFLIIHFTPFESLLIAAGKIFFEPKNVFK